MQDGKSGSGIRDSGLAIRPALVLVALPCVALAAISAWWVAAGLFGAGLWPPDRVTLAEAIATRNNAEALRLIADGADPNRPSRVRDGLLSNGYEVLVTPVEAAVGAQRADSLRMLLANGASVDERELRVLRCYERTRPDSAVRAILEARAPGDPSTPLGTGPSITLGAGPSTPLGSAHSTTPGPGPDCAGVRLPADRVE